MKVRKYVLACLNCGFELDDENATIVRKEKWRHKTCFPSHTTTCYYIEVVKVW